MDEEITASPSPTTAVRSDVTMFPFDRVAIDYERIQRECFANDDDFQPNFQYHYSDESPANGE